MKVRLNLIFCLVIMMLSALTLNLAFAKPHGQGGDLIPTPTLFPVEIAEYEVSTVGGEDTTQVFERGTYDEFNVYETQLVSNYPHGMEFSVTADSSGGDVTSVSLLLTFSTGESSLFFATEEDGVWIALPWKRNDGQPAWIPFEFQWIMRDQDGNQIETKPKKAIYWDYTQAWTRLEFDTFIVYSHDFEDIYPLEEFAQRLYDAIAATEPRRLAGFGGALSYKPTAVIYATEDEFTEIFADALDGTIGGYAADLWGVTVQYFDANIKGRALDSADTDDPVWEGCIWIDPEFNPALTEDDKLSAAQASLDYAIYQTLPHELTHLLQADYGIRAPEWWTEGQAEYFTYSTGNTMPADPRLRHLISLDSTLPDLEDKSVSRTTEMDDGCVYMVYSVGHSFVNWFVGTYGIATHAEVVRLQSEEFMTLFSAIEEVTGEKFYQIQNAWRAYIGFDQLELADVDPIAALEDAINPLYQVGDEIVLAATPVIISVYATPGAKLTTQSCFAYMHLTILRSASLKGVNYYRVNCEGTVGWLAEDQLPAPSTQ